MAEMSGKQALMEQLAAEGVEYVFGNPGTTEQPFMDILQDYPQIQYILALQEATALGMADAYAWACGRPAFVQLHAAPGLGNAMGMLYNAHYMGTPLVVYAGQQEARGVIQEILLAGDLVSMARPVTKWSVEVQDAADIPTVLRRAFKTAAEPPRGPVFISIPLNVMDQTAEMTIAPATYPRWRVRPDPQAVAEATDILAAAQSPVIVVGDGVALSGAMEEAVQLAELIGAQVYDSFSAELTFPTDHPLYQGLVNILREAGLRMQLAAADVLLIIGAPAFRVVYPMPEPLFAAQTKVIQIDASPWELAKNWPATLAIGADCQMALRDLLQALLGGDRLGCGPRGLRHRARSARPQGLALHVRRPRLARSDRRRCGLPRAAARAARPPGGRTRHCAGILNWTSALRQPARGGPPWILYHGLGVAPHQHRAP